MADDQEDFKRAGTVTQVFSSVAFLGLFIWLIFTNGHRLSHIRKQERSKRLECCVNICIYVAFVSAFCNLFQLTEVDDSLLPRQDNYVVDMARPIEWMLTCPFLQLALVLMGGTTFPEYRMLLMPTLSLALLVLGTLTQLFSEVAFVWLFFAFGGVLFCIMLFFNRLQIMELTDGKENLWEGESKFRTATLILMLTWMPFPLWFALSPEGAGLIQDVMMIQGGWAFLNVTAKFVLIFFIQSMKTQQEIENKFTEVKEIKHGAWQGSNNDMSMASIVVTSPNHYAVKMSNELYDTIEAFSPPDASESIDRICQQLADTGVHTSADVLALSEKSAKELDVPWEFISVLQNHLRDLLQNHLEDQKVQPFGTMQSPKSNLANATSTAAGDRSRRRVGFNPDKASPRRIEELIVGLTKLHETQHAEVMAAVQQAQATAERSEAKVDAHTEMLEKTASSIVHEQGKQLATMMQQIESRHAAQIQHQAESNQNHSLNVAAKDEMQIRRLDTLSSNIAHIKGTLDKMKFDTKHDELHAKMQEANTELLSVVREVPDRCSRSIISGIVQQNDAAHSSIHEKLRELEDHVQISVVASVEQLAGKLIKSTEAIMVTIQDCTERSLILTSQNQTNVASPSFDQIASFPLPMWQQQGDPHSRSQQGDPHSRPQRRHMTWASSPYQSEA